MSWFRRTAYPGTPQAYVPELEVGSLTFKVKTLDNGNSFYAWTCQICLTEIGACGSDWSNSSPSSLRKAIFKHMNNCPPKPCGQESCIVCALPRGGVL